MTDVPPPSPPPPPPYEPSAPRRRPVDFSVGDVLSQTLAIWMQNLLPLAALAVIAQLPGIVIELWGESTTRFDEGTILGFVLTGLVSVVMGYVVTGAVMHGVYQRLRGRSFDLGGAISIAISRVGVLFLASFFVTVVTGVGFLLLIVPGIIVMVMLYLTIPAVVVERQGPLAAMERSIALGEGHRWSILGIAILAGLLQAVTSFLLAMLINFAFAMVDPSVREVVNTLVFGIVGMISSVATGVTYYTLRRVKEGVDLEDLAQVFS